MKVRHIVMAVAALGLLGCADIVQTPALDQAPAETQEVAALVEGFFNQAEAELLIEPEHRGERIRGRAVIALGPAELHLEVIPRGSDTLLAETLHEGVTVARLSPAFLEDFQGERSRELGVITREEVGAYLLDHERQPVCGDRMLGVVAELALGDDHTEDALLWLHIRRSMADESQPSAQEIAGATPLTLAGHPVPEMNTPMSDKKVATPYIDCGDDWSVWGTPDCNSGPCIKTCRVKVAEAKVKGIGVLGAAQWAIPFPVYRTITVWGKMQVGGTCGVDDGWTYNSCACIAECPDN